MSRIDSNVNSQAVELISEVDQQKFTAETFLNAIRPSNKIWIEDDGTPGKWVYRGQRNAQWKLLPSAHRKRDNNQLRTLIDRMEELKLIFIDEQLGSKPKSLYHWCGAEISAIVEFCNEANFIGLPVASISVENPTVINQLQSIVRNLTYFSSDKLPVDAAGLAQHHGIPTRLLDWTRDPLIAAGHAAGICQIEEDTSSPDNAPDFALWALRVDTSSFVRDSKDCLFNSVRFVFPSNFANPFLFAQSGLFTLTPYSNQHYVEHEEWPDLESIMKRSDAKRVMLKKLVLPGTEVHKLKELIQLEGYSLARLMPTHDNVATLVKSGWN